MPLSIFHACNDFDKVIRCDWGAVSFHIRRKRWGIPHTTIYPVFFGCRLPCLESSRRSIGFVDCKSRSSRREVEVSVAQYNLERPLPIHIHHALCTHSAQTDKYVQTFQKGNCYSIFDRDGTKSQKKKLKTQRNTFVNMAKLIGFLKISKIYAEESPLIQ